MASHFHRLKIKSVRQETPDCLVLELDIPDALQPEFAFEAGQHLTIRQQINGQELRRNYSICSSPHENQWSIAIKQIAGGAFSNWAATQLSAGQELDVMPPMGKFVLPADDNLHKHYLFIAGGSGITPIISLIKSILKNQPSSSITLVYANRNRSSIIFKDKLEALKNRYMQRFMLHYIFSREQAEAPIFEGRIDAEKCKALFERLIYLPQVDEVFICGPAGIIETVKTYLEQKGVAKQKIHYEVFTAAVRQQETQLLMGAEKPSNGQHSQVTIKIDGAYKQFSLAFDGPSILDAALKQGADLPYACKSGVCCTCKARLLKGQVQMDLNYGLEPAEVEAGYILTCQSHPLTPDLLVDYDAR